MTYAIVETGGTQLRVEPGRFYDVNRLAVSEDDTITLDKVLFVSGDDGALVGQPLVEGAAVSATVMRHLRGPKLIVYKMQPKKKTRKKQGHRQELTRIMVDSIAVKGKVIGGETVTAAAAAPVTQVDTPAASDEEA
jgi:large subunit ribosomal protein L21